MIDSLRKILIAAGGLLRQRIWWWWWWWWYLCLWQRRGLGFSKLWIIPFQMSRDDAFIILSGGLILLRETEEWCQCAASTPSGRRGHAHDWFTLSLLTTSNAHEEMIGSETVIVTRIFSAHICKKTVHVSSTGRYGRCLGPHNKLHTHTHTRNATNVVTLTVSTVS